jgi:hypothetical protein
MSNIGTNILCIEIIRGIKNVMEKMILTIFDENRGLFYLEGCIGKGH